METTPPAGRPIEFRPDPANLAAEGGRPRAGSPPPCRQERRCLLARTVSMRAARAALVDPRLIPIHDELAKAEPSDGSVLDAGFCVMTLRSLRAAAAAKHESGGCSPSGRGPGPDVA